MQSSSSRQDRVVYEPDMYSGSRKFIVPDEIPIDPVETLNQLTGRFRSVRDGLPELVKNSKDQYSRLGVNNVEDRQIVVIADTDRRTLAVVDFAGAPASNFEGWTKWSDPTAGQVDRATDIEAGHGNGGKAFMVRGAHHTAFLESCYQDKWTRKGFINNTPTELYKPGFAVLDGVKIDDVDEFDPVSRLQEALSLVGMSIERLPVPAQKVFDKRRAFTIAYIEQTREWIKRKRPKLKELAGQGLVDIIGSHGQTAMTIETCQVWVVRDREIICDKPITLVELPPYPGFETPREFEIPDVLPDPENGEAIRVGKKSDYRGHLHLKTSHNQLQISPATRARNVIRIWNQRNNVATWMPQELHPAGSASFVYGELRCPALTKDHLDGATRQHLVDTALVRALKHWTAEHVTQLSNDLHRAMAEKTSSKDRERANRALSGIRELMRRYLDPDTSGGGFENGQFGEHSGDRGEGGRGTRARVEYGNDIHEIELEPHLRDVVLIAGTRIPLFYRCFEHQDDGSKKPVRHRAVVFRSEPEGMCTLDSEGMLTVHGSGLSEIWLETKGGMVSSNRHEFWALEADHVELELPTEPLLQGQRLKLDITFRTPDGPLDDTLIDGVVKDASMGAIGRHGMLTVRYKAGELEVRIHYGADPGAYRDFFLQVGDDKVPPREGLGGSGSDVPEILLCGEEAPGMEDLPLEKRTMPGGHDFPTIIEDPLFPNIVWINPNSKEAIRVRKSRGGSSGLGKVGNRTFMQFVALKCFDILKRLYVRQQIAENTVTDYQYTQYAVYAEMECADFIDAAWDLTENLLSRERG